MTDRFFATYDEFVILTKAWKMHGSLSHIVVNILIELASNSTRYTGGKLAMDRHPDTCLISNSEARSDGSPGTTRAAIMLLPLACG